MKKKLILRIQTVLMLVLILFGNSALVPQKIVYAEDEFQINENGKLTNYNGNSEIVVVPDNVTSIGYNAFFDYNNLINVELPNVTDIEDCAFGRCFNLISIKMPNVIKIGYAAFSHCDALINVEIPNLTNIGNEVFSMCTNLKNIEIPNTVNIGNGTFAGCYNLNSIELPNVVSIGDNAFYECGNLSSIELPNVTSIEAGAFYGCNKLTIYAPEGSYAQTYALENNIPFKVLSNTDTPDVPDTPDTPDVPDTPNTPDTDDTYSVDAAQNSIISASDFETILKENETKDVVIRSNNNITFTFAKGTMQAVDTKDNYNFAAAFTTEYDLTMPVYIPKNNFAAKIDFAYSGKLPAKAKVCIPVGESYAGKILYYYLINTDNTYTFIQSAEVNSEGFVTVEQDHCSSYIFTNEKLQVSETKEDTTTPSSNPETSGTVKKPPQTGDTAPIIFYCIIAVSALSILLTAGKYKETH